MEADGLRLDGAATSESAGTKEGRAGRVLRLHLCRRRVVGGLQKKMSRATPVPGEAASWERTTTASSVI